MIDSDVEFFKIKHLMEKNPKLLKDDPLMSLDYLKILTLIKRKKLIENSSNHYDPADAPDSTFFDYAIDLQTSEAKRLAEAERFAMTNELGGGGGGERLSLQDEDLDESVKSAKKKEQKEKNKLMD